MLSQILVVSRNVNKYGSFVFTVSKSYRKRYVKEYNLQILYFILMEDNRGVSI